MPQQERLEDPDKIETAGVFREDGLVNVTQEVITAILQKTPNGFLFLRLVHISKTNLI